MSWSNAIPTEDGTYWYRRAAGEWLWLLRLHFTDLTGRQYTQARVTDLGSSPHAIFGLDYFAGGQWARAIPPD
jgi:hypothetical protein